MAFLRLFWPFLALLLVSRVAHAKDTWEDSFNVLSSRRLLNHGSSAQLNGTDEACCEELQAISFTSTLPVVIVDTGGITPDRTKRNASLCTCGGSTKHGDYDGEVEFYVRGGSDSQLRNKIYQYAVKLPDTSSFLGMPSRKNFILYAQELDPFGIKNWLGFHLSRQNGEYASSTTFAELFIIDDDTPLTYAKHYRGLYLGEQKIGQGKNDVDVSANTPSNDPSQGGYILEFEHGQNYKNAPNITGSVTGKAWNFIYPKHHVTPQQVSYMQGALNNFEVALFGSDFADPQKGWRQYANETAFGDWFLTEELVKNAKHSYHSAAFMSKDGQGPLAMGPIWDLVQGFGTCCGYPVTGYNSNGTSGPGLSGGSAISPNGWLFDICLEAQRCSVLDGYDPHYGIAPWFTRLWQDPAWIAGRAARWQQLRGDAWSDAAISAAIDKKQHELGDAALRTLSRWSTLLSQPQYYATPEDQVAGIFSQVSSWLMSRLEYGPICG